MNTIRAGRPPPVGLDLEAWERLRSLCESPNFEKKSEAMQYANSCRQNVGRTGPGGEIGVRESLKNILQRSPESEEVQAEMTRDKGYGGKRKMKQKVICENQKLSSVRCDEEDSYRNWGSEEDFHSEDMPSPVQGKKAKSCPKSMTTLWTKCN